jgi:hypothetical protein
MFAAKALFGCLIRTYVRVSERFRKPLVYLTELRGRNRTVAHRRADWKGRDNPIGSDFLPAASAGEDLSLAVGIPASWAELNCGARKTVDRFH